MMKTTRLLLKTRKWVFNHTVNMKKFSNSFFVFASAMLVLAGCQRVEMVMPQSEGAYKYSFTLDDDTRAEIGEKCVEWVSGDKVGIFMGSYKGSAKVDVTTTPKKAILYSDSAIPAGTMVYAYAPYDADNENKKPENTKIVVNNVQYGSRFSAMPMAGLPFKVEEEISGGSQKGNGSIRFMNLGSLINFKIFSSDKEIQGETVMSVQFEATAPIAGVGHIDLTAVDMDKESTLEVLMDTKESAVKVIESTEVVAIKGDAKPIKMVVLPGKYEGVLTVVTDVATYKKAIPEREFGRSHSRTFSVDLANSERTEGGEEPETFFFESFDKFVGETSGGNDGKYSGSIANYSLSSVVFDESGWSFKQSNAAYKCAKVGYLESDGYMTTRSIDVQGNAKLTFRAAGWDTREANVLKVSATGATLSGDTDLTVTNCVWEDYAVIISEAKGDVVLTFSGHCYFLDEVIVFTGNAPVKPEVKLDPELAFGDGSLSFFVHPATEFDAPELTNPYNVKVVYSSSDEDVAQVDKTTGKVTIGKKEGMADITASFDGNFAYLPGSASYRIIVRGEGSLVVDKLDLAFTGVIADGAFKEWSGKSGTSGAIYAGYTAGTNSAISLKDSDNSGVVTTSSGGKARRVVVAWNGATAVNRTMAVFGSNTPYKSAADLFDKETQGDLLGTLYYPGEDKSAYEVVIKDDYKYVGFRSEDGSGTIYLMEVKISWE